MADVGVRAALRRDVDAVTDTQMRAWRCAYAFLPKEPLRTGITGDDAPSPAARYQSIVDKLFPDGVK